MDSPEIATSIDTSIDIKNLLINGFHKVSSGGIVLEYCKWGLRLIDRDSRDEIMEMIEFSNISRIEYAQANPVIISVVKKSMGTLPSEIVCELKDHDDLSILKHKLREDIGNLRPMKFQQFQTLNLKINFAHQREKQSKIPDFKRDGACLVRSKRQRAGRYRSEFFETKSTHLILVEENVDELFCYPFTGRNQVTIKAEDARRLQPGSFLNDNIIEFYIRFLCMEVLSKDVVQDMHVFNTFFYEKFTSGSAMKNWTPEQGYVCVRSWTKKMDLSKKRFIVIPVNESFHWYLIIIVHPGSLFERRGSCSESQVDDDTTISGCKILVFNSLPHHEIDKIVYNINSYLSLELNKGQNSLKLQTATGINVEIPRQSNPYDCGVYLLQCFEHFMRNPTRNLLSIMSNKKMDQPNLFSPQCITKKRFEIVRLAERLQSDYKDFKAEVN